MEYEIEHNENVERTRQSFLRSDPGPEVVKFMQAFWAKMDNRSEWDEFDD